MATSWNYSLPSTSTSSIPINPFLNSIGEHFHRMLTYEDESLLRLAKSHIPVDTLQVNAIKRLRDIQKTIKQDQSSAREVSLDDVFIVELMDWFKTAFFAWVDKPPCAFCTGATIFLHNTISYTGLNTEIYKCTLCDTLTEFPRYNDLRMLLKTRKGRCGEWAQCFTLLCRAMDYDSRLVVSNTDHIWTEVYSFDLQRWLHCDPCENTIDSPLMYEVGWAQKLDYIIAYSKDEVQDVTWKYSMNHKDVLSRRNKCSESELIATLMSLRNERWQKLSDQRAKYIKKRLCSELVDMMMEKEAKDNEKVGRSSGSLVWRIERKEISSSHVWEIGHDKVCLKYNPSKDEYELSTVDGVLIKTIKEWIKGVYEADNMKRKEEHDWKMVYLTRTEKSSNAKISWKIKTKDTKQISNLEIKTSSHVFYSGKVDWTIQYNDLSVTIPRSNESSFILKNIKNLTEFILTAELSGGDGNSAWQHSQIFRQEIDSIDFPLQISITLGA